MVNKFHIINVECAVLVPQRPGHENVPLANKVCMTVSSVSSTVNGHNYVELSYSYHHLWRASTIAFAAH